MKKFGLAVCLLLVATCAFAAAPMKLTMATGGTSGTYYPFGGAIAQILGDKTGLVSITAQSTGASIENVRLLNQKDVDLALIQNDTAHYAHNGIEAFKDGKITSFKAIARLYPEVIHIAAGTDGAIKSMNDFKGKKVSVGAPGSGTESNARFILAGIGIDYKQFTPLFLSFAETSANFKDRQVEAFFVTAGVPNPALMDITTLQGLHFIPIGGFEMLAVIKQYPFFSKFTIPANSYKGQEQPVDTLAVQAVLVVRDDLPDDIVYAMTKALFENKDAIAIAHAKGKEIDVKKARDGITIPFHPGAEKYLSEVGVK